MTSDLAIRVQGLHKAYSDREVVAGVDLAVRRGEVFALLGPNGAGKTTTVEILEGHRERDSGTVEVLGYDPARNETAFKERIGIVLQTTGVERYLNVRETVELYAGYYTHPRGVAEVLAIVGLTEQAGTRVRRLSGGQQRRLDVAIGLAGDPELLFLDEPTTGLDPSARRQAWEMIRNLRTLGKTVFLTTHYLDEAEQLADTVAIIAGGRIIAEGAPETLAGGTPLTAIEFRVPGDFVPPAHLGAQLRGDSYRIEAPEPTRALHALTSWAVEQGVELHGLNVSRPSLEDTYLSLIGQPTAADSEVVS